ncbi:MAG: hypothetical protein WBQ92_15220, partial [Pseudomonas alloputida]
MGNHYALTGSEQCSPTRHLSLAVGFMICFRRGLLVIVSPQKASRIPGVRLRKALMASVALVGLMSAGQLWAFNLDDVA